MEYNKTEEKVYNGVKIQYGIINGDSTLVFIKTGRGGNIFGENEKQCNLYVNMANSINLKYGFTVVVSDNPLHETRYNPLVDDFNFLNENFRYEKLFYVGYSSGANYGSWYGCEFFNINKMLLINPTLNYNYHKTDHSCRNFQGNIKYVLGEKDESSKWLEFIPKINNVKYIILQGQDHHIENTLFEKTVDEFLME